ncbi:hypothetical protein [Poriferisphaera corsica]|uniref:hypothetical protein n=1 Tax=Poriferisphaera corsica TaxID=2528020 RepID=UPI00190B244D|nr:hypothetical protein [Poriferisphaera corsica]
MPKRQNSGRAHESDLAKKMSNVLGSFLSKTDRKRIKTHDKSPIFDLENVEKQAK